MLIKYNLALDSYVTTCSQAARAQRTGQAAEARPWEAGPGVGRSLEECFPATLCAAWKRAPSRSSPGSEVSLKQSSLLQPPRPMLLSGIWLSKPGLALIFKGQGLALFLYNSTGRANPRCYCCRRYVKWSKVMQVCPPAYLRCV